MEGESDVTRCIIDELHFSFIQGDQMEGESSATRSIIEELLSSDIQGDQMEGESGDNRSIIDELDSSDIKDMKWKVEVVLLEVPVINSTLRISKEIK